MAASSSSFEPHTLPKIIELFVRIVVGACVFMRRKSVWEGGEIFLAVQSSEKSLLPSLPPYLNSTVSK